MTPDLALQEAVRAALIASPGVAQHVAPERVRSGAIRPETMPAIVLSPARVEILGRASGRQIVAQVSMMLHVWVASAEDGGTMAHQIAAAAVMALMDAPDAEGFWIDKWDRPALAWMPDPDPVLTSKHGAISLRAAIRWRAD